MSIPINPANIAAAANLISGVADRVGDALSFDEVLHGDGAVSETSSSTTDPANWLKRAVERIEQLLSGNGIGSGESLQLSVEADAKTRVTGGHPRAAEIESLLAGDSQLSKLLSGLVGSSGPTTLTVSTR